MRRGFASMLMGLSLLVASAGWAGVVFTHSVLDEDQSRQLSAQLVENETVHAVLTTRLGEGMERYVPPDEPMSRQELRGVAARALADPPAAAAVREAISEAQRLGLAGTEVEPTFSHFDVNEAARHALIAARPSLRGEILVNPLVRVRLPIDGLKWFSGLKSLADRFAIAALAAAAIGFVTSFIVADQPVPILRRGAWWILVSAAGWMVVGFAFGAIVRFTVPSSYVLSAAAVETALRAMRNPSIVMAAFGVGLLSVSYVGPAVNRRRGAMVLDRAGARPEPVTGPANGVSTATVRSPAVGPLRATTSPSATESGHVSVGRRLSAAWKEGHGYLDDARVAPFFSGSSES